MMIDRLIKYEGLQLKPYKCSAGYLTIGVGRNLDTKGISKDEAIQLLLNDIEECTEDLKKIFPKWSEFSGGRWVALKDIRFQHGGRGFRLFKKMIKAIKDNDFEIAIKELLDSLYAKKFPSRANANAELLKER